MSGTDRTGLDRWVTEMRDCDPSGSPPPAQGRECKMVCSRSAEGGGAPVSLGTGPGEAGAPAAACGVIAACGLGSLMPRCAPRTACSTPATVRRARTACVRPCPPTSGPVPPTACCSAAGGTACAVSVRQPARRAWGGLGTPGHPLPRVLSESSGLSPLPEGKPSLGPLQPRSGRAQGERGRATRPLTCVSPVHPQPSMRAAARRPRATPTWWIAASPPAAP